MSFDERKDYILSRLNEDGIVYTDDLREHFDVSEMTVRRDFDKLEEAQLLRRIKGGAIPAKSGHTDFVEDTTLTEVEKTRECEAYIREQFQIIGGVPPHRMTNLYLSRRDVLLYSWFMQVKGGLSAITLGTLVRLIGSGSSAVIEDRLLELESRGFIEFSSNDSYDFSLIEPMIEAIANVFGDPKEYNLLAPIPFFQNGITGDELIGYFSELTIEPPPMTISEIIRNALQRALPGIVTDTLDAERGIYLISKPNDWNLMIYAVSNNCAVSVNDLNAYIVQMSRVRGRNDWDGLLFAPNSENIEVVRTMAEFPGLHHVWSITAVRFFSQLQAKIDKHGADLVTEAFDAIVPDDRETFSVRIAMARLEKRIGELS